MVTTMVIKQSYSQVDSCHRLEVSECIQLTVVLQYVGVNSMFVPGKHHDAQKFMVFLMDKLISYMAPM